MSNFDNFIQLTVNHMANLGDRTFDFMMLLVDWSTGSAQALTRMMDGPDGQARTPDEKMGYFMRFLQFMTEADNDRIDGTGAIFTKALMNIMAQTCAADPEFHKEFEGLIIRNYGINARRNAEKDTEDKLKEQVLDTDGEQGESAAAGEETAS